MPEVRELIAAEVRAEMARQRKTTAQLGQVLDVDQGSASLRHSGQRSFKAEELVKVAEWLGVPLSQLTPSGVAA